MSPEYERLHAELVGLAKDKEFELLNDIDDTLTYALFPQPALKFFQNRNNLDAFEPAPQATPSGSESGPINQASTFDSDSGVYTVEVDGKQYVVKVSVGGDVKQLSEQSALTPGENSLADKQAAASEGHDINALFSGSVYKIVATQGIEVADGDVLLVLEAVKMETEIRSNRAGVVRAVHIAEGESVSAGDAMVTLE